MTGKVFTYAVSIAVSLMIAALPAHASKDQRRLPGLEEEKPSTNGLGSVPFTPDEETPDEPQEGEDTPAFEPTLDEVETVELTMDLAKRAVEVFVILKNNYQDTDIAEYESLEAFVAGAKEGPALEKDVKAKGFETVGDWNTAITSVSFAYAAIASTQEDEIKQEIENIKNEVDLDESLRKSLIEGLQSMLPSENNKKIVTELNKDKAWAEKLKLLEESEEVEH